MAGGRFEKLRGAAAAGAGPGGWVRADRLNYSKPASAAAAGFLHRARCRAGIGRQSRPRRVRSGAPLRPLRPCKPAAA